MELTNKKLMFNQKMLKNQYNQTSKHISTNTVPYRANELEWSCMTTETRLLITDNIKKVWF